MNARRFVSILLAALLSTSMALAAGGGGGGGGGGGAGGGGGGGAGGGGAGGGGGGAGGGEDASTAIDPEYTQAVAAIEAKQFPQAIQLLQSYLTRAHNDAYAENWLAYSYRKSGQLDQAFLHYDRALKIDPDHRGAHEYLGEAYLMTGNLAKAEEHLKILDKLCFFPCTEYTMLKKAVAEYKSHQGTSTATR